MPPRAAVPAPKATMAASTGAEKRKQKVQLMKPTFKVLKVQPQPGARDSAAPIAPALASEEGASRQSKAIDAAPVLPGMGEYEDSSDDDEGQEEE